MFSANDQVYELCFQPSIFVAASVEMAAINPATVINLFIYYAFTRLTAAMSLHCLLETACARALQQSHSFVSEQQSLLASCLLVLVCCYCCCVCTMCELNWR